MLIVATLFKAVLYPFGCRNVYFGCPLFRDDEGRWRGAVVAIDAIPFSRNKSQFELESIQREITKVSSILFVY